MESKNTDSGALEGCTIDIVSAVAEEMDARVVWVESPWTEIFGRLKSREADMIASSVTITPEREAEWGFSRPYFTSRQQILVQTAQSERLRTPNDFATLVVGVQAGTTGEKLCRQIMTDAVVKSYPEANEALADLLAGGLAGVVIDEPVAAAYAKSYPRTTGLLAVVEAGFPTEHYGFVFRPDSEKLRLEVDDILDRLEKSGRLAEITARWAPVVAQTASP